MRKIVLMGVLALLVGCGSMDLISERGDFLAYGHGSRQGAFQDVYADAAAKCQAKNLVAMHTSTVCPDRCVTNFECVKR
jgi:hypothetical protein